MRVKGKRKCWGCLRRRVLRNPCAAVVIQISHNIRPENMITKPAKVLVNARVL